MQSLDTKSIKRQVTLSLVSVVAVIILIIVGAMSYMEKIKHQQNQSNYNLQIQNSIKHTINHYVKDYTHRAERFTQSTEIQLFLKQRDRKKMYNYLQPEWDLFLHEAKPNFTIMHVHLNDGTTFLRMHKPEFFGDNLKDLRPMLKEVHHSHEPMSSYEAGKHGMYYRHITPLFDREQNYLGAFELGIDLTFITHTLQEITGFTGLVFIKDENRTILNNSQAKSIEGYHLQSTLTHKIKAFYDALVDAGRLEENMKISIGKKRYKTHLFRVKDFQSSEKVKILVFQDISDEKVFSNQLLGLFIAILLFSFFFMLWFIHRSINLYHRQVKMVYDAQKKKLGESEKRLRLLYEQAPLPYQSLDVDGNILTVDSRWCEELGYEKSEIIGKNFSEFLVPSSREKFAKNFPKFKEAGVIENIEFEMLHKNAEQIMVSFTGMTLLDDEKNFIQTQCIFTNITEQYKTQQEIKKLTHVLEKSPIAIVITDEIGKIEYVNPWFTKITGYSFEEAKGENPRILKSDYHPADDYVELWDTISHGKVWTGTFKNVNKHGAEFWESSIIAPVMDDDGKIINYIALKQEITENIHMKLQLIKQVDKMDSFLRASPIGVGIVSDRVFKEVNDQFCIMTGYDRNELLGRSSRMLYASDEEFEYVGREKYIQIKEAGFGAVETQFLTKDSKIINVLLSSTPINSSDLSMGVTFTVLDITDRIKTAKVLHEKDDIMIAQSQHAAMGEMISMIAHQWRQPLSIISMGVNNLIADVELESVSNEEILEHSNNILQQTEYLSKTIDDFRNFFRPQKEIEEVLPKDVINEVLQIIGKSLENNNITFNIKDQNEIKIKTYSHELLQVYINLLKNSKEALVENRTKNRAIEVVISDDEKFVIITVCDNGGGMDEKVMAKIYEPYFSTKDDKNGTGLGLYMSKTIIEKHLQGRIKAYNTIEGACFKVSLPKIWKDKV